MTCRPLLFLFLIEMISFYGFNKHSWEKTFENKLRLRAVMKGKLKWNGKANSNQNFQFDSKLSITPKIIVICLFVRNMKTSFWQICLEPKRLFDWLNELPHSRIIMPPETFGKLATKCGHWLLLFYIITLFVRSKYLLCLFWLFEPKYLGKLGNF